ncbi:AMP-binding protein [Antrihabitans cavernicola]|uniref:AMP-binding protein n=1 Tax=Antrihabitans cavernicola TaxID=2495913 RepID=A0A5A7SBE9_9NOCA|nr:AMP-binding protein [Spelaeibacter cavernicola]KAA0023246.1 AMP-binding protein [Spelaeibacter cavernicola]
MPTAFASPTESAQAMLRPELLAAVAAAHPGLVAASSDDTDLTYGELDSWSNRLARVLIARGARPGVSVAVAVSRTVESIVARWAVAKVGATVAPAGEPAAFGIAVKSDAVRSAATVEWLMLDDLATMRHYMTVSDAPVTDTDRSAPALVAA